MPNPWPEAGTAASQTKTELICELIATKKKLYLPWDGKIDVGGHCAERCTGRTAEALG